jgi:WD40 repeat protein
MSDPKTGQRTIFSWQNIIQLVIVVGLIVFVGWSLLRNAPTAETPAGEPAADTVIITPERADSVPVEATVVVTVTKAVVVVVTSTPEATVTQQPTIAAASAPTLILGSHSQYFDLPGHAFLDMDLSPDGNVLAVAGYQGIWLFQMKTLEQVPLLDSYEHPGAGPVSWAPDNQRLAVNWSTEIRIIDSASRQIVQELAGGDRASIMTLSWSPAGRWLLTGGSYYRFWNITLGEEIYLPSQFTPNYLISSDWSPDGNSIALGAPDGSIVIINMNTVRPSQTLFGPEDSTDSIAWSPDGTLLASSDIDSSILIWQLENGETTQVLRGFGDAVTNLAWSPDSRRLASAHNDGIVWIWDVGTGQAIYRVWGHESIVSDVVWLPDGRLISLGREDGNLRIWQLPAE